MTITQNLFCFLIPGHQNCLAGCWTAPQEDTPVANGSEGPEGPCVIVLVLAQVHQSLNSIIQKPGPPGYRQIESPPAEHVPCRPTTAIEMDSGLGVARA